MNVKLKTQCLLFVLMMGIGGAAAAETPEELHQKLDRLLKEVQQLSKEHFPKRELPRSPDNYDLRWTGSLQAQGALTQAEPSDGSSAVDFHTIELRRVRLGLDFRVHKDVKGAIEANFLKSSSPLLRKGFLKWTRYDVLKVGVGLDKPLSSLEENTSSKALKTIERSYINNLTAAPGPLTGVFAAGEWGPVYYGLGTYTDQANANTPGEPARDLHNVQLGLKIQSAKVQATWLQSWDEKGVFGRQFNSTAVFGGEVQLGGLHLQGEVFLAEPGPASVEGWYLMPSMKLSEVHEAVVRVESTNGLRVGLPPGDRYAESLPLTWGLGSSHRALYLGWNWRLSEDLHKVMLALEGFEMKDSALGTVRGQTLSAAWRVAL